MRSYNIMWARAQISKEIEQLLSTADDRVRDTQQRIERAKIQLEATK